MEHDSIKYYIYCPTEDMWDLCQKMLKDAGYRWISSGLGYVRYRDTEPKIGFYGKDICKGTDLVGYKSLTFEQFRVFCQKYQLNDKYTATINKDDETVTVGCETFSFEKSLV